MNNYLDLQNLLENYLRAELLYNDIKNPNYFKGICYVDDFGNVNVNKALINQLTHDINTHNVIERKDLTEEYTPLLNDDDINDFEKALLNYVNNVLFNDIKKIYEKNKNRILMRKSLKGIKHNEIMGGIYSLHVLTKNYDKYNIINKNVDFLDYYK